MEKVLFVPLALRDGPGSLTRAVARELAVRVAVAGSLETRFVPIVHVVENRRVFGVYPERLKQDDLRKLLDNEPGFDLLVHGDLHAGDPFCLNLEVLRTSDLGRVVEENFEAPHYDGFKVIAAAAGLVLRAAGQDAAGPGIDEFPAHKFDAWLDLLRGREGAAALDAWSDLEDPEALFIPYFDALDIEPGLAAAKEELAMFAASAAAGRLAPMEAAEAAIRRLVKLDRKGWRGFAALGQILGTQGDLRGAEEALRKALEIDPGRATLRFDLGMLHLRQDRTGRAGKVLETVKSDPRLGAAACYQLGLIRERKEDLDGAVKLWRQAVGLPGVRPEVFADLGRALASQGRFDEAEDAFKRGLEIEEPCTALPLAYGIHLAEQDRFQEAVPHLESAIRQGGAILEAHLHLGRAFAADGRRGPALHHLRKALRAGERMAKKAREAIDDVVPSAHQERMVELLDDAVSRPAEEQVVLLKALLKEESSFPEARTRLGIALIATGKPRKAEGQFRKALKLLPDDPEALSGLATALRTRGKLKAAVEAHQQAIEQAPNAAIFHLNLADTMLRRGEVRQAIAEVELARALEPDNPLLPGFIHGVKLALTQSAEAGK